VSLARRTRRDFSDKRVRKIVKEKLKAGSRSPEIPSKPSSSLILFLKPIFYFIVFVGFIYLIYYLTQTNSFMDFFTKSAGDSTITVQKRSEESKQSSTGNEDKTEPSETAQYQPLLKPVQQKSQIEVLNGCGTAGIARSATDFLRKGDFDVVYMGNYKNYNVNKSMVIDRIGNKDTALKIASLMGISQQQVKTEVDKNKQLDASVILGKDYQNLKPFKE
jgi:hypothetical protein